MDTKAAAPERRVTSRFIPLTRQAIIADLCADPHSGEDREVFAHLAHHLQRHRGRRYRDLARELRRSYLPFSPDRDTIRVLSFSPQERRELETRLSGLTRQLLERANYAQITTDELNRILNEETPYSLRIAVDLAEYDEMQIYAREVYTTTESVRRPETLYLLKAKITARVYRRLFVLLKLKSAEDRAAELAAAEGIPLEKAQKIVGRRRKNLPPRASSDFIYIKIFKDMPEHDLQILFPLRTVQFRPFDKLKFAATAGGGTLFGVFSLTGKLLAATNPIALAGALVGFIAVVARQVTTFFNQRNRYMMELAQKLFFHNLANNRAALVLLLDRAEEEDVKEDLITLYFNAGETVPRSELPARKRRIEELIATRYGAAVEFEMADSIDRLVADGAAVEEGDGFRFATLKDAGTTYRQLLASEDERAKVKVDGADHRAEVLEV